MTQRFFDWKFVTDISQQLAGAIIMGTQKNVLYTGDWSQSLHGHDREEQKSRSHQELIINSRK